jgi:hypothetical protein
MNMNYLVSDCIQIDGAKLIITVRYTEEKLRERVNTEKENEIKNEERFTKLMEESDKAEKIALENGKWDYYLTLQKKLRENYENFRRIRSCTGISVVE